MPLVRAEYRGLVRRVAAHSNQGRNEWGSRGTIPRASNLYGEPNSPNNVTSTSLQYICFRKTSGLNMGVLNLLLAPGPI